MSERERRRQKVSRERDRGDRYFKQRLTLKAHPLNTVIIVLENQTEDSLHFVLVI